MTNPKPSPIQGDHKMWAHRELASFNVGDRRLKRRIIQMSEDFAAAPQANIPQASGNWPRTKAAYRFFSNENVSETDILAAHRHATIERMRGERLVLVPQDTTFLNFTTHPHTAGLGPIGNNRDKTIGLLAHSALALSEEGLPMGLLHVELSARDPKKFQPKKGSRNRKSIEEKESHRWLKAYRSTCEAARELGEATRVVSITDREGDIYELFLEAFRQEHAAHLLVRAQHPRRIAQSAEYPLWQWLGQRPAVAEKLEIEVPAKGGHPARTAVLSIRFAPVVIEAPMDRAKYQNLSQALSLWAIEVREERPPKGAVAICWRLLTSLEASTPGQAIEKVRWYAMRWQIEVFHRVLKSGCQAEARQLETAARLRRSLALDMVVAWRIFALSQIGRKTPAESARAIFTDPELAALHAYIHKTRRMPPVAPTLGQALRWVAGLGGFLGRKGDGDPGPTVLWRGLSRLADITAAWETFNQSELVGND
jgi:hypothetical protein